MARNRANRKTVSRPKGVTATSRHNCRTVSRKLKLGKMLLKKREANLPAFSQPPAKPSLCFFNDGAHWATTDLSALRISYIGYAISRIAATVSGYGVSQQSTSPTWKHSPSKRPVAGWSPN